MAKLAVVFKMFDYPARVRRDAEDMAAQWDARLRGGRVTDSDRRMFHIWLQQHPAHHAAHERLQHALTLLRANASMPELRALRGEARDAIVASEESTGRPVGESL